MTSYGLIGHPLGHSYSGILHSILGNGDYSLIDIERRDLPGFLRARRFKGLNVTAPYKRDVMPFCDRLTARAEAIGCVNTLYFSDGELVGDNTDFEGMKYLLRGAPVKGARALILGSGATSATAEAALAALGAAEIRKVSRKGVLNYGNADKLCPDAGVIVNATPIGTFPGYGESPVDLSLFKNLGFVADVVYNPYRTRLILQARELGIEARSGLDMLAAQAVCADAAFFGRPENRLEERSAFAAAALAKRAANITLVGMAGVGKTTVGRELAKRLGMSFFDLDEQIERQAGATIPEIFAARGEPFFRECEKTAAAAVYSLRGAVVASGGGAVLDKANAEAFLATGPVVWLKRDVASLPRDNRPMSKSAAQVAALYEKRMPIYQKYSDVQIECERTVALTAEKIVEALK